MPDASEAAKAGGIATILTGLKLLTVAKLLSGHPGVVDEKDKYAVFEALNPFFEVVLRGLSGLVDCEHYFDAFADDAVFESRYHFPGWAVTIQGKANLMTSLSGYGKTIKLHSGDALIVRRSQDSRIVILEYEWRKITPSTSGSSCAFSKRGGIR